MLSDRFVLGGAVGCRMAPLLAEQERVLLRAGHARPRSRARRPSTQTGSGHIPRAVRSCPSSSSVATYLGVGAARAWRRRTVTPCAGDSSIATRAEACGPATVPRSVLRFAHHLTFGLGIVAHRGTPAGIGGSETRVGCPTCSGGPTSSGTCLSWVCGRAACVETERRMPGALRVFRPPASRPSERSPRSV